MLPQPRKRNRIDAPSRLRRAGWVVTPLAAALVVGTLVASPAAAAKKGAVQSGLLPVLLAHPPGSSQLFVLGSRSCKKTRCLELWRGDVGGRHFTKRTAPHSSAPTTTNESGSIGALVFANGSDGYAIPPFYENVGKSSSVTTNGGRSWRSASFAKNARIIAMTAGGGFFDAVIATCTRGKCHDYRLERSKAGSRSWTSRSLPDSSSLGNIPVGLGAYKTTVFVSLMPSGKHAKPLLLVSSAGGPFAIRSEPALGTVGACSLWPTSSTVLWAECPTGMMASVERGVGSSPRFTRVWTTSGTGGSAFSAVTSTLAFRYTGIASPLNTLERTTDGGTRFSVMSRVAGKETSAFGIVFSTQSRGDLLVSQIIGKSVRWSLLATSDAGRHFRRVNF